MAERIARTSSWVASALRLGAGARVGRIGPRPDRPIALYEFESCPFCRKVREALTTLDLDVTVHPCPKRGSRYRDWVVERGGKAQFPYLVDRGGGFEGYESDRIIAHLFDRYGDGSPPWMLRLGPITAATASAASLVRGGAGTFYRASERPERSLRLYAFEASPDSRLVREELSVRELPYELINVGLGSPKRESLRRRTGRVRIPRLEDVNTGAGLDRVGEILRYLRDTYGRRLGEAPPQTGGTSSEAWS